VIELRDIERDFLVGESVVRALRGVSLAIPDGDYCSIMGPSGSGKSTLLNILGCLDRPTSGTYRLDGVDVASLGDDALSAIRGHRIGFVFQFYHLVPRLTAAANVELPMVFAGVERRERAERVSHALASVALARAVVMGPSVLLADEPTGNLDSAAGAEIVALLEGMNARGLTLIVVTHDPDIGRRARHRLRLVDGAIAEESRTASAAAPGSRA